jgi:RHS repeat-associated protein
MLPVRTFFEWSGMRLCGERNDKVPLAHTLYLYEEGSWQPLARVDSYRGGSVPQQRVLYYHSLPNGFAPCLTNSEGEIVWRGRMQLWGTLRTEENRESYSMHPAHNLRFAGQYLDRETGLHYNTFRYYAPESGRFTQLDPISIRGGLNLYAYAPNPLSWIDPLGLTGEWVNPKDINFSQRTISPHDYADIMRNGGWDWDRSPLRVIDIDGQLVSYDNRRLDAAREAGLDKVKVIRVDPNAPHPDSSTGKTWLQKFRERFRDRRNIKAGGIVPDKGLNSRPERTSRGCK